MYSFRYESLFCEYILKFFSDNYQIIGDFDNPVCAPISRIDYVPRKMNRGLPGMTQVDSFISNDLSSIVLLSLFATFSLISFSDYI